MHAEARRAGASVAGTKAIRHALRVDDAELDAELERLEREELEEQLRWTRFVDAIEAGAVGPGYAGHWTDDNRRFVAATAGDAAAAQEALAAACPDLDVQVISVERSLLELDALMERVFSRAEALRAGLSAVGVEEPENRVEVMLVGLEAPAARTLRREFNGEPIAWTQGEVTAAWSAAAMRHELQLRGAPGSTAMDKATATPPCVRSCRVPVTPARARPDAVLRLEDRHDALSARRMERHQGEGAAVPDGRLGSPAEAGSGSL